MADRDVPAELADSMIDFARSLSLEYDTSVLPGASIRGLTSRSIGLFGNSIANSLPEFVPLADNVANEANAKIIYLRSMRAVFMSRGRFDFTLASQFVNPSLASMGKREKHVRKELAQTINSRLQVECFGNSQLYKYILNCFLYYTLGLSVHHPPEIDTLTPDEAVQILAHCFDSKVFYTMWYGMRHAVNLEEVFEDRMRPAPADHPNGTVRVCSQIYMLSKAIFKIMGYHIFVELRENDWDWGRTEVRRRVFLSLTLCAQVY